MPSNQHLQTLRRRAFEQQGGRCYYCGVCMWQSLPFKTPLLHLSPGALAKLQCTAEHMQARSAGGANTAGNITAACAHCNHTRHQRKNPPDPDVYRKQVRRRMQKGAWHNEWVHAHGLAR
ncbi:HNH endonuclease [Ideonella sp.]|uniref:HNH endonuclease n=1 Tax=Ideonella sp. TaxID=1929293 RepID=UPI003BB63EF4